MNPILQMLNRPNPMQELERIRSMANGNPSAAMDFLMQKNPQFRQFVEQNRGKTPEQIAQEHGIDMNTVNNLARLK